MRGLVPAALAVLAFVAVGSAATGAKSEGCGSGTPVLDLRYRVLNDLDTGVRGNSWAFDTYTRTVKVWRKAPGRYCSASTYGGAFTTLAGSSPGGGATIPAGIRGTLRGSSTTTFRGTAAFDGRTTRGDLGTKDFACTSDDRKGDCSGTFDWLSAYFTSTVGFKSFRYVRYDFTYRATAGGRGTWRDFLARGRIRTSGDIVSKKGRRSRRAAPG
jgi:hypothetical protein